MNYNILRRFPERTEMRDDQYLMVQLFSKGFN